MTPLIFILKVFDHRPVFGTLDYWVFGITVFGILFFIFRKKITAFVKKIVDKFKKKQSDTADTTTDATATTTTPDFES